VLESDEKWSSQLIKSLQIAKLLILVTLISVLNTLVNKMLNLNTISVKNNFLGDYLASRRKS